MKKYSFIDLCFRPNAMREMELEVKRLTESIEFLMAEISEDMQKGGLAEIAVTYIAVVEAMQDFEHNLKDIREGQK